MDEQIVVDQPVEEAIDQPIEQNDSIDATEEKPETPAVPEEKVDGRKFNPEWSKALKELRELYPEKADMLIKMRDGYARAQTISELNPKGIDGLREWKTTFEALGGQEAAAEMMQRVADYDKIDAKIEAGDFSVVSELPENMQKGFYAMIPDAINTYAEKDPQGFSQAIAPHFQAALAGTGMGEHLKEMYRLAGDNDVLKDKIKQQYDWYMEQTKGGAEMPKGGKTESPEVARLRAELANRQKGDDEAFTRGIVESTEKHVSEAFTKNAEVYLKQFNLTEAQKSDLLDSFKAKLTDKLGNDTAFNKQLGAYKSLKNRSADTVNSYIRGKVDENAKSIIDGLVTARYGGTRQKAAAPVATPTTSGGATRVSQAPPQESWNRAKMESLGYEETAKKGIYHLSDGRVVQVVRQ